MAAAVAAILASHQDPDSVILLMPADHRIGDVPAFLRAVEAGREAAREGAFVLFGITPTAPATGYGYIHCGDTLADPRLRRVLGFQEKPDQTTAEAYLAMGNYAWNSGIFLLPVRHFLEELVRLAPQVLRVCTEAIDRAVTDLDFLRLDPEAFRRVPDISIDYAVMEQTPHAVVVPTDCAWCDIGAWSDLCELTDKDGDATATLGDVVALDTKGCYIRSDGPLVATIGLEDLIVVATADVVMIAPKNRDQDVKKLVDRLKAMGYDAAVQTPQVHRPWGFYQSLHTGERFQVKRITVTPGQKLSLQQHYHRAEHWIVVNGTALVTRDDEQILLRENESVYLPLGCVHRLENPGRVPLNLIEVQSGAYLGEDDIVRIEDIYARDSKDGFEHLPSRLSVAATNRGGR
ncbi:mannose-1-phosphate guanylyltransferase/mannose-6-phosphate isomerase [Microvirga aerilata]|uniref:mannose-1-phosphate guanylyltransferase/mannose-6-phosphate isomerase n=1 Tax=Microvirga aerilata TaxID=670292 RepID=UPI0028A5AB10|nr:mannose-1-phosphate guanylyltransferase/mannose-6-phosphate isomerase [Microvirga aerilata]